MSTFTLRTRTGTRRLRFPSAQSIPRPTLSGLIIVGALLAFEIFNYSTTEFALGDVLGDLSFSSVRWATILALAFCGMDFAGVTRILTPADRESQPLEVWYLLGAWLLAATMNAMLTWWAVSLALIDHQGLGNQILGRETLTSTVPIFVALLVWLIRILMIGTFTLSGGKLLRPNAPPAQARRATPSKSQPASTARRPSGRASKPRDSIRPAPKPEPTREPLMAP